MFVSNFISVTGTIGAGKTSLVTNLAKHFGYDAMFEPVKDNPYLDLFYKDMGKYAFAMQVWLLNCRYRQHKEIVVRIANGSLPGVIQDRNLFEDQIFCTMLHEQKLISDLDYKTYLDLLDNMVVHDVVFPGLIVYLRCSPETAMNRIAQRGRACEKGISMEYMKDLHSHYEAYIAGMKSAGARILEIDYEKFLPVEYIAGLVQKNNPPASLYHKHVRALRTGKSS